MLKVVDFEHASAVAFAQLLLHLLVGVTFALIAAPNIDSNRAVELMHTANHQPFS